MYSYLPFGSAQQQDINFFFLRISSFHVIKQMLVSWQTSSALTHNTDTTRDLQQPQAPSHTTKASREQRSSSETASYF